MIHIVRSGFTDDSILSRKAKVLVDRLGWVIASQPDSGAFLNYAFPYIDYRGDLPFAAYFTHREDCRPAKVKLWEEQAQKAVLRITSAQQYYEDLSRYGPTAKILPPLDRDKFTIKPGNVNKQPIIGVAGYVYNGGRKGENLLAKVVNLLPDFSFKAMGRGWPVETINLPFKDIQSFYHGIDIFLCTSLIEGVPYPPLEALSCGKRVVIPRGVGLLDELPNVVGIERYEVGNVDDMMQAILRVYQVKAKPEVLRRTTEVFSDDTWVDGHVKAFAQYEEIFTKQVQKDRAQRQKDRGIYVVAIGISSQRCARRLIASVREQMPDMQVAVVSDQRIPEADINIDCPDNVDVGGRIAKLKAYELVPKQWKYSIYLDADTELIESIDFIFYCLEQGWEMVLVKDVNSRHMIKHLFRNKAKEDYNALLQLVGSEQEIAIAGGVWGFRKCSAAENFLKGWLQEWGTGKYRDQVPMAMSFYQNKVKALFLGNDWNCFTRLRGENRFEIIRHYSGAPARLHNNVIFTRPGCIIMNKTSYSIARAGKVFIPGRNVITGLTDSQRRQIKSCTHLKIMPL